jgi:hypothetical protein
LICSSSVFLVSAAKRGMPACAISEKIVVKVHWMGPTHIMHCMISSIGLGDFMRATGLAAPAATICITSHM